MVEAGNDAEARSDRWKERSEEYKVKGEQLLEKVKELVHEGNVRRLIIRNEDGRTLIEVPLTVGVVGALFAPVWAALGAVAALVASCSIIVVREEEEEEEEGEGGAEV